VTPSSEPEIHFPSNSDQVSTEGQPLGPVYHAQVCLRAASPHQQAAVFDIFLKLIIISPSGILETIFDGIQRPLKTIADVSGSVFVPRGVDLPCLDQDKTYTFIPNHEKRIGSLVAGGDTLGTVFENDLFPNHLIMAPPNVHGTIVEVMPEGDYTVSQCICVIETTAGKKVDIRMSHFWPVRTPRPFTEKLAPVTPLTTGQRVLDALFPTV